MTITNYVPSAVDVPPQDAAPGGGPIWLSIPSILSGPSYTNLPPYWSYGRDVVLQATIQQEDMWAAAVGKTATKFAAHGYVLSDSEDNSRKISAALDILKGADGGQGWVTFAQKLVQDVLTTDNGCFIRIRRAGDEVERVRLKAARTVAGYEEQTFTEAEITRSRNAGRIVGLYHLDSLRCTRTGNLTYPVRYRPIQGPDQLLRYDQVMMYADMPSSRAELLGVGFCAASRAYRTIAKLSAMERLVYEGLTGGGAHKIALIRGIMPQTLESVIEGAKAQAAAKGMLYYLGTILGAVPSDIDLQSLEIRLKELAGEFSPEEERKNGYMVYANAIGIPVQDLQPLSGQGLGTGTQTVVLQEAAQGVGLAAFIKWWEQTVSDRVLPATTTLEFRDENDVRDQKARAEVQQMRATTRKTQIDSGEISPPMARQLASDAGDLPPEFVENDATAGGVVEDDEKPADRRELSPFARALLATAPATPPKPNAGENGTRPNPMGMKEAHAELSDEEIAIARRIAREAAKHHA